MLWKDNNFAEDFPNHSQLSCIVWVFLYLYNNRLRLQNLYFLTTENNYWEEKAVHWDCCLCVLYFIQRHTVRASYMTWIFILLPFSVYAAVIVMIAHMVPCSSLYLFRKDSTMKTLLQTYLIFSSQKAQISIKFWNINWDQKNDCTFWSEDISKHFQEPFWHVWLAKWICLIALH